jgi:hypothetical protein
VDVHPPLLTREEEKSETPCPKDRRTHNHMRHRVDRDDYWRIVAERIGFYPAGHGQEQAPKRTPGLPGKTGGTEPPA